MNIIIPMAGAGSRFQKAGYTLPKPLIDVNGKPMIQVVIENINIDANYIFIVRQEHYDIYNLKSLLQMISPNCKIVQVDHLTEGSACTTLLAKEYINNEQLLIVNSDQWIDWKSSDFLDFIKNKNIDGSILTFENKDPRHSYVRINSENKVLEVKEKEVISNQATVGIYYWLDGLEYIKYANQMMYKNIRINNEFYVAPIYNEAINDGKNILSFNVNKMYSLGIPEDLEIFLNKGIIS